MKVWFFTAFMMQSKVSVRWDVAKLVKNGVLTPLFHFGRFLSLFYDALTLIAPP
jgi:hypothetical protein